MVPAVFISSSLLYAEDKDAILKEYDVVLVLRAKEGVSLRMMAEMLKAWFGNEVVVITPELEVSLYFLSAGFKLRGVEDGVLGRLYSGIPTNLQDE